MFILYEPKSVLNQHSANEGARGMNNGQSPLSFNICYVCTVMVFWLLRTMVWLFVLEKNCSLDWSLYLLNLKILILIHELDLTFDFCDSSRWNSLPPLKARELSTSRRRMRIKNQNRWQLFESVKIINGMVIINGENNKWWHITHIIIMGM